MLCSGWNQRGSSAACRQAPCAFHLRNPVHARNSGPAGRLGIQVGPFCARPVLFVLAGQIADRNPADGGFLPLRDRQRRDQACFYWHCHGRRRPCAPLRRSGASSPASGPPVIGGVTRQPAWAQGVGSTLSTGLAAPIHGRRAKAVRRGGPPPDWPQAASMPKAPIALAAGLLLTVGFARAAGNKAIDRWCTFGFPLRRDSDILGLPRLVAPFPGLEDPRIPKGLDLVLSRQRGARPRMTAQGEGSGAGPPGIHDADLILPRSRNSPSRMVSGWGGQPGT